MIIHFKFKIVFLALMIFFVAGCIRNSSAQMGAAVEPGPQGAIRVSNFDECAAAGYVVTTSMPRKCTTPSGKQFIKSRAVEAATGGCENLCGDGTCQQIVCMAVGCPCAETPVNCANDCASSSF